MATTCANKMPETFMWTSCLLFIAIICEWNKAVFKSKQEIGIDRRDNSITINSRSSAILDEMVTLRMRFGVIWRHCFKKKPFSKISTSTRLPKSHVFENIHSGYRFQKVTFSGNKNAATLRAYTDNIDHQHDTRSNKSLLRLPLVKTESAKRSLYFQGQSK